ncbi:MAG TPA: carbohydrate ABC transporter permease [Ktedonobacteraceae bacterium]|nr:carbohydrate ABC transporter permease [Ktedonobacteraceae bacterium]
MRYEVIGVMRSSRRQRVDSLPITWSRLLIHVFLIVGGLLMLYPAFWMLSASFKPSDELFSDPSLWPKTFTLENYINGWNALDTSFGTFFLNSFIVCLLTVIGNVLSCSLAAYAFARLNFVLRRFWFAIMLGTIMLPGSILIVPQYVLFKGLGWLNTFLPLTVPRFLATDAFFVFLLVQFIRTIPTELDDSARIDGCGRFQLYWRIILPLALPALVTTAIFSFITAWGDFFGPLIYLNDQSVYTVAVALRSFVDSTGTSDYGAVFAMGVLSLIPVLAIFLLFQRLLLDGIATSGIKG